MIALTGSANDKDESERAGGKRATAAVGPGMPNVSVPHRSGTFMPDRRHVCFPSRSVMAMPSSAPATRAACGDGVTARAERRGCRADAIRSPANTNSPAVADGNRDRVPRSRAAWSWVTLSAAMTRAARPMLPPHGLHLLISPLARPASGPGDAARGRGGDGHEADAGTGQDRRHEDPEGEAAVRADPPEPPATARAQHEPGEQQPSGYHLSKRRRNTATLDGSLPGDNCLT